MKKILIVLAFLVAAGTVVYVVRKGDTSVQGVSDSSTTPESNPAEIPLTRIKLGMLPYGDHTQAIIGIEKGFFRDVGIEVEHSVLKNETVVPFLRNGTVDIASTPPAFLYPAYERDAPALGMFVLADLFQGYAIFGQPTLKLKSFSEFIKEGMKPDEAIRAAVGQVKGRRFAYPAEPAIKPFIDVALQRGGLLRTDFTSVVQDDPITVNSMRNQQADFQVGGAPSRIVMEREGYKAIITAIDLAQQARPSAESPELASIFPDGWATSKKFFAANHAAVLRIASVSFRINQLIRDDETAALAIHMPFLSRITGQKFSVEEGRIIYRSLDPFYTFGEQASWYNEKDNPLYYLHLAGSGLNSFIKQGIYKNGIPTVEDFIWADDVYRELGDLSAKATSNISKLNATLSLSPRAKSLLAAAERHFSFLNYYDAERFSKLALESK